jgi:ubiquinone biosynthesis protein Coq4
VTVWHAVEDAPAPSAGAIALLAQALAAIVAIDAPAVAAHAHNLAKARLERS